MLGLYALLAASFVELFEPLVLEGLDHAKSVACCATLVKTRNASGMGGGYAVPCPDLLHVASNVAYCYNLENFRLGGK